MKKYDVTALGRLLVDFTENGISEQGNALFEGRIRGGAPCNVLSMLQKGEAHSVSGEGGKGTPSGSGSGRLRRNRGIDVDGVYWIRMCRATLARWCRNCLTETGTSRSTGVPVRI